MSTAQVQITLDGCTCKESCVSSSMMSVRLHNEHFIVVFFGGVGKIFEKK